MTVNPSREVVAGAIDASCTCCAEPRALIHHIQIGPTRMVCPQTGRTFLDRGDGLFQADGQLLAVPPAGLAPSRPTTEVSGEITTATELLSDRPARTADKTRISLERATFAGGTPA